MVFGGFAFDSIKAEKAIAIWNYRRRRKLQCATAFSLCLFLLSPPSSGFFSLLRHVSRRLIVVFNSHVFVFMFFNAMIFLVYSLSGPYKRPDPMSESTAGISTVGDSPEDSEKQAASEKNAVFSPASEVAVSEIVPETKRYRRTESERYEGRKADKLRRSNTEICRKSETAGGERRRVPCTVNEMDIDDFNKTVESFIAEQKWQQREEFREEQITTTEIETENYRKT